MLEFPLVQTMTHTELDHLLRRSGAMIDASECHGTLCGMLCAPAGDPEAWLQSVLDGLEPGSERMVQARKPLVQLAEDTRRLLRGGDLSFTPLLPEEAQPLTDRVEALGAWCEGFLFGLGNAGLQDFDRLPPTSQEFVRDLVEIARVGAPAGEDDSDEEAFTELVEYLRVGVHLLHNELHPGPAPAEFDAPPGVH